MAKIIIQNAMFCPIPVLISVIQSESDGTHFPIGTPILTFNWDNNTIPSDVNFMQFTHRVNANDTPSVLATITPQQSPYIYGGQPLPPLGSFFSLITNSTLCGLEVTALINSTL